MTLKLNRSKDNVLVKFPQKHRVITSDIQKTVTEYSNWKITEKYRTNMKKNSSNKKAKKKTKTLYFPWNNSNGINGINVGFRGENGNKESELNVLKWINVWASHGDLIITKYVDGFSRELLLLNTYLAKYFLVITSISSWVSWNQTQRNYSSQSETTQNNQNLK